MVLSHTIIMWVPLIVCAIQAVSSLSANDSNALRRRLVVTLVKDFNGPNSYLKGVGAISIRGHNNNPHGDPYCTGTLIEPPPEAQGFYVLTAAHCVMNHEDAEHKQNGYWNDPKKTLIQFGLIKNRNPKSKRIITCGLSEARISNEWPYRDEYEEFSYDYAVLTLKKCWPRNPTEDMQVTMDRFRDDDMKYLIRAGYRGTRALGITLHTTLKRIKQNVKRIHPLGYAKVVLHAGDAVGGDSGGPLFHKSSLESTNLVAIYTAVTKYKEHSLPTPYIHTAVKLYQDNIDMIDQMILGQAGISYDMVFGENRNCEDAELMQKECWGSCFFNHHDEIPCFETEFTVRPYAEPKREIPCGFGQTKRLCGSLRDCQQEPEDPEFLDKECLGPCIMNGDKVSAKCPSNRRISSLKRRCNKGRGRQHLCYERDQHIQECEFIPDTECWSKCHHKRESGICHKSNSPMTIRQYVRSKPLRRRKCGIGRLATVSYLCGPIRHCDIAQDDEWCQGDCQTPQNAQYSCPPGRGLIHYHDPEPAPQHIETCTVRNEYRWLCHTKKHKIIAVSNKK